MTHAGGNTQMIVVALPLAIARAKERVMRDTKRNKGSLRLQAGFSLVELLISIAVMGIMIAITVFQMQPVLQQMRANRALYQVSVQLRLARQTAIGQRRSIQVQFSGNNEIKLIRREQPGGQTVLSDTFLNNSMNFLQFAGMPDTLDGFGNAGAIVFGGVVGGPPTMQFQSDGTFIDGNGTPLNGTVFLGMPNVPSTARAITVLGATGRVRAFHRNGAGWSK